MAAATVHDQPRVGDALDRLAGQAQRIDFADAARALGIPAILGPP
ncbi:hypothetical protein [Nonomuraea insulae]|uniref:Uncharacterized protein n=1 Tax=Nonomuraea insulae TaxID=1616787 RepID=A0ABW1CLW0_9ACTN